MHQVDASNPFVTSLDRLAAALSPSAAKPLLQREDFFRRVLESLSDAVIINDPESRIIYANQRVKAYFGYEPSEMIGHISYELLVEKKNWPEVKNRIKSRLKGENSIYEMQLLEKGGTPHWVRICGLPYRAHDGQVLGHILVFTCLQQIKQLEEQNDYLRTELSSNFGDIIGSSPALKKVLSQIDLVASADAAVLIYGESGTGKELLARAIHERSPRKEHPLVKVNCGAIPENLFESEFFGHARGAFTGALKDKAGRFELAAGGTIFLDEIGELPPAMQSKLLRVLQEKEFERVGESFTRKVDARIVAATNRDLKKEVDAGRFRQDLFYRLSVFPIEVPPLRERREDIPLLAAHFARAAGRRMKVPVQPLNQAQARLLSAHHWPGNVRELQNAVERAVILSQGRALRFDTLGGTSDPPLPAEREPVIKQILTRKDLKQRERDSIIAALEQTGGKIFGTDGAALLLGMKPTTLASRVSALGLKRKVSLINK
jgi:PAS domain S-box-containing protein